MVILVKAERRKLCVLYPTNPNRSHAIRNALSHACRDTGPEPRPRWPLGNKYPVVGNSAICNIAFNVGWVGASRVCFVFVFPRRKIIRLFTKSSARSCRASLTRHPVYRQIANRDRMRGLNSASTWSNCASVKMSACPLRSHLATVEVANLSKRATLEYPIFNPLAETSKNRGFLLRISIDKNQLSQALYLNVRRRLHG